MQISLKSQTLILFVLCIKSHIAMFGFNFFYYSVESDVSSMAILFFNVKLALILISHLNLPGLFLPWYSLRQQKQIILFLITLSLCRTLTLEIAHCCWIKSKSPFSVNFQEYELFLYHISYLHRILRLQKFFRKFVFVDMFIQTYIFLCPAIYQFT